MLEFIFVKYHWLWPVNQHGEMHLYCTMDEKLRAFPYCTLSSINFPHAEVLWQHLDYKMLDQRAAKRRDSGTFTCQMVAPLLLPSCHWATTGGSLEAEAYAIQHAWSAVQLVASKHSSEAKQGKWQNTCRHKFRVICFTLCTCMFEQLRL